MVKEWVIVACGIGYLCIALGLAIAASSMMVYQNNSNSWRTSFLTVYEPQNATPNALLRSWAQKPFVDIQAYDSNEFTRCPEDTPEDVIFDVWMGSRLACDCRGSVGERIIGMDRVCEEESNDCKELVAIPPMVLNVLNGVRFCGKLSELTFSETVRPYKVAGEWVCPRRYLPCNEEFFEVEGGEDYVVCYPEFET